MSARDCDRTRELLDGVPSTSEQQWLQAHARQCEHCRADVALAALLADAPAPAFTEHDELADRRLLDAVLDTARQQHDAAPLLQTPRSPRRAARVVLWAMSAAAVLAVAAVMVTWLARRPAPQRAQLYLAAGDVRAADGTPARVGDRPAGRLRVGRGQAALAFGPAVRVQVASDTQLELPAAPSRELSLRLLQGKIVASVNPARKVAFSVQTAAGRIEVSGTTFSVRAHDGQVTVSVARGSVRVTPSRGDVTTVQRGQQLVLGEKTSRPLLTAAREAIERAGSAIDALAPAGSSAAGLSSVARLFVHSTPSGAMVRLDGIELGRTPVAVHARAGTRLLEVRLDGRQPIREHVVLRAGARLERDFELAVPSASSGAAAPAASSVASAQPPRAKHTRIASRVRRARAARRAARRARARHASARRATHEPSNPSRVTPSQSPAASPSQSPAATPSQSPTPTAAELLGRARALRTARRFADAAKVYRTLIRRFASSRQAASARVSLGYLLLDQLHQPKKALAAFHAYGRRGALAQEAAYGEILALRALGRSSAQIAAMRAFVKRFPKALQRRRIERELRKLDKRR